MKTSPLFNTALLPVALVLVLSSTACATAKFKADAKHPVSAGQAVVTIAPDAKSGAYELNVTVDHIAEARRIDPALNSYVLWAIAKDSPAVKLGSLQMKERKRRGSYEGTTALSAFNLVITVEGDAGITEPNGTRIIDLPIKAKPKK